MRRTMGLVVVSAFAAIGAGLAGGCHGSAQLAETDAAPKPSARARAPGAVLPVGAPAPSPAPAGAEAKGDRFEALRQSEQEGNTESYAVVDEPGFRRLPEEPVSTFSVDVDTASYANVRRFLNEGRLPPPGAVRIEELVNYFPTADLPPSGGDPFALRVESAACPWAMEHRLVRVALRARDVPMATRPAANLVFLVDVSGSMAPANKLPLLQQCLKLLAAQVRPDDRVAMAVYAGAAGMVLPPTTGEHRPTIVEAIDALRSGGSTNGGEGIRLAYRLAREGFVAGGVNRVILCTDGDFNVGVSNRSELEALVREEAKSGVFLTVLGFGTGNLKDDTMETLADRGNGNYSYIDSLAEGRKVLVEQAGGTLVTVAKDTKIQVEFNPAEVAAWRLVGYENRLLAREDFLDDAKDAGDVGAGHSVTAFYELVPKGRPVPGAETVPLRYQDSSETPAARSGELLTVRVRFKEPEGSRSREVMTSVRDGGASYAQASPDFKFQAAVASFGMLLRNSAHKGTANWDAVIELADEGTAFDPGGYRREFVALARKAKGLAPQAR